MGSRGNALGLAKSLLLATAEHALPPPSPAYPKTVWLLLADKPARAMRVWSVSVIRVPPA